MAMKIWECKIGEVDAARLPPGSDFPMRKAVAEAYERLTGTPATFLFSGWGGTLNEHERRVVDEYGPTPVLETVHVVGGSGRHNGGNRPGKA